VTILDQLDHPDAGQLRAKLGELTAPGPMTRFWSRLTAR
jgi:hypothetical protein